MQVLLLSVFCFLEKFRIQFMERLIDSTCLREILRNVLLSDNICIIECYPVLLHIIFLVQICFDKIKRSGVVEVGGLSIKATLQ
mgnify:CR=1 FL=1